MFVWGQFSNSYLLRDAQRLVPGIPWLKESSSEDPKSFFLRVLGLFLRTPQSHEKMISPEIYC